MDFSIALFQIIGSFFIFRGLIVGRLKGRRNGIRGQKDKRGGEPLLSISFYYDHCCCFTSASILIRASLTTR